MNQLVERLEHGEVLEADDRSGEFRVRVKPLLNIEDLLSLLVLASYDSSPLRNQLGEQLDTEELVHFLVDFTLLNGFEPQGYKLTLLTLAIDSGDVLGQLTISLLHLALKAPSVQNVGEKVSADNIAIEGPHTLLAPSIAAPAVKHGEEMVRAEELANFVLFTLLKESTAPVPQVLDLLDDAKLFNLLRLYEFFIIFLLNYHKNFLFQL